MWRFWGICAALVFTLSDLSAEPVATLDFARKDEFESAKISPQGDYLALATPRGDQTALTIIDLKNRKISGSLHFTRGEHVADYWWVSASRVVVSIANRDGPLDQKRSTGELYAMNADGSRKAYLFGYRGGQQIGSHVARVVKEFAWAHMVDPLPDDPDHALISIWPWHRTESSFPLIELINVHTGQRKRMDVVPAYAPIDVVADRAGLPRFAYGMDEKSNYLLFARDKKGEGWKRVELPGGPPESVDLRRVSRDGDSVFLTTHETNGRGCLRQYHFETGGLTELYCHDTGHVGQVVFAFDGSRPIALNFESGRPETRFLDATHPDARLLKSLNNNFAGQRVDVVSRTADGNKLVLFVDGDRNPGDYFLFDRGSRTAEYLLSRRSWINPKAMQPVNPIQYQTRDGATVYGYLTAQTGLATRKSPLVLMPHGGPHGIRDYWVWDAWAQFLASRGYAVLQPNYRGSGGYGEAHQQAGYKKWGTLMQDDLTDAVRWAVAEGIVDADRVCIFGASYGGYAALMSAVREPDLYRCAVGFAGVYDLERQSEDSDTADSLMGRNWLNRVLGSDEKVLAEQSPITYIETLKVPVLIVHGTEDKRVPFSQAKLLRKALEKHGKTYEWLEFDGEEHGFHKDENHTVFLNKLVEFLDKQIGAKPVAAGQDKSTGGS
jgi:dipeptidyl aminopeptidase/acylaminoacyl peptidase